MGETDRKGLDSEWLGDSACRRMLDGAPSARSILIRVRGRHHNGREEHNLELMWKISMKHVDLETPITLLDQAYSGMHSA